MTAIIWPLDAIGPSAVDRDEWRRWETANAWAEWAKYSCVEWNGDHLWVATLTGVEDSGSVDLSCSYCHTSGYDLYPDAEIHGEVDGIPVEGGQALTLAEYVAPVNVRLVVEHYPSTPFNGEEWDVWVEVTSRPGCVVA